MKTKLKAFTLLETLIASILTALLLLLGNNVLRYSFRQFFESSNQNRFVSNIISLHSTINKLMNESESITSEGTTLTFASSNSRTILYFEDNYVLIKNREASDTLLCKTKITLANQQFIAVNTIKLLESFTITISADRVKKNLMFKKHYSKDFLFNLLFTNKNI